MEEQTESRDDDGRGNAKRMERLRSSFDQLLVSFMNEKSTGSCIKPIAAWLRDGRPIDLFKLFWEVWKIGGHESVSENKSWGSVSDDCGFDRRVASTIKSTHKKYLDEFDQCLRQLMESGNSGLTPEFDVLCREFVDLCGDAHREENVKSSDGGISELGENPNDLAASAKRVVKKAVAKRVVKKAVAKRVVKKAVVEKVLKNETSGFSTDVDELPKSSKDSKGLDKPLRIIPVSDRFQAKVHEWTGVSFQSDPKWLGTTMWPKKDGAKQSTTISEPGSVGEGSQRSCECADPNSVECYRFHIAEKRLKLKVELGSLFYQWRFNRMGEEVSLSWTDAEENRIKDMTESHDGLPKWFWYCASRLFRSKTRENLVSYYHNVFVVRRRSYQNRVTPEDVNSDDDEKDSDDDDDDKKERRSKKKYLGFRPSTSRP